MATESSQLNSSSSHRLPTVSATQALQRLRTVTPRNVSTGLPRLDDLLNGHQKGADITKNDKSLGGLACGQITDIYGPPGVGKTAFCLQATISALQNGAEVIWIDCGTPLSTSRLKQLLRLSMKESQDESNLQKLQDMASRFHHYAMTDLAHLLALFMHSPPDFPSEKTSLIIIDSISTVFEIAFQHNNGGSKKQPDAAKWASNRRYAVMGDLVNKLEKTATMNNLVVLVTKQTRTKIRSGAGALLQPALAGIEWDNGVATQLVLFRDFPPRNNTQQSQALMARWNRLRYVGVIKANGVSTSEDVVPFTIETNGLSELPSLSDNATVPVLSSPSRPSNKRAFEEVADSEDGEGDLISDDDFIFGEDDLVPDSGLLLKTADS